MEIILWFIPGILGFIVYFVVQIYKKLVIIDNKLDELKGK